MQSNIFQAVEKYFLRKIESTKGSGKFYLGQIWGRLQPRNGSWTRFKNTSRQWAWKWPVVLRKPQVLFWEHSARWDVAWGGKRLKRGWVPEHFLYLYQSQIFPALCASEHLSLPVWPSLFPILLCIFSLLPSTSPMLYNLHWWFCNLLFPDQNGLQSKSRVHTKQRSAGFPTCPPNLPDRATGKHRSIREFYITFPETWGWECTGYGAAALGPHLSNGTRTESNSTPKLVEDTSFGGVIIYSFIQQIYTEYLLCYILSYFLGLQTWDRWHLYPRGAFSPLR